MEKSKTFCVMPHIGMQIQHNGRLSVCNNNNLEFTNQTGHLIQVHKDKLQESWNTFERQDVKKSLDAGVPHYACHDCFDKESGNLKSQRMLLNEFFETVEPSETQPKVLIIKPGNVCNLACRMCSPEASSSWYSDAYKLSVKNKTFTGSYYDYAKTFSNERDGFHTNNKDFWQTLKEWIPNLTFMDIYGGEPFLSIGLFESLTDAADKGLSSNTSLQLSTNLTIYNEKYLNTLLKYKHVTIKVSIDSHNPSQLNYIRYPCDPHQILENLKKFQKFFAGHDNIFIDITLTVTPLNIFYLDEITKELSKYSPIQDYNTVHVPAKYDIRILPNHIKSKIIEKIKIKKLDNYFRQEVDPSGNIFRNFIQETKDLDNFRNQDFKLVFPEFYELIKDYFE